MKSIMAKEILKAAVYCGTYYKYNCGSIAGRWMRLADYESKAEFYKACRKLHEDEHDPEFMFQDWEHLSDGQVGESWVSEEVWSVIAEVKKWDAAQQQAFYSWCEENGYEQDMKAVEEFKATKPRAKAAKPYADELRKAFMTIYGERFIDGAIKDVAKVIKIGDCLITFEKPDMETSFCFGWSSFGQGLEYGEAIKMCAEFSEDDFVRRNLERFDIREDLDFFKPEEEQENRWQWEGKHLVLVQYHKDCNLYKPMFKTKYEAEKLQQQIGPEGRLLYLLQPEHVAQYKAALLDVRATFEKRLRSYIKRYGVSKLRTWTYCCDD